MFKVFDVLWIGGGGREELYTDWEGIVLPWDEGKLLGRGGGGRLLLGGGGGGGKLVGRGGGGGKLAGREGGGGGSVLGVGMCDFAVVEVWVGGGLGILLLAVIGGLLAMFKGGGGGRLIGGGGGKLSGGGGGGGGRLLRGGGGGRLLRGGGGGNELVWSEGGGGGRLFPCPFPNCCSSNAFALLKFSVLPLGSSLGGGTYSG